MSGAPRQPKWQLHAPTGKRYFKFQLNGGKFGYRLDDGSTLTESDFDQLTNPQSPPTAPRTIPGATHTQSLQRTQSSRTNSGQAETTQLPQDSDQSAFIKPVAGSPPSRNYVAAPWGVSALSEPHRRGPTYNTTRLGAVNYASDLNSNRYLEQNSVRSGQLRGDGHDSRDAVPQPQLNKLSKSFVAIYMGDFASLYSFVSANPDILSHTVIDNLIAEAHIQEEHGNQIYPQRFVHHALLLEKCMELDPREQAKFFERLEDRDSDVRRNFTSSVKAAYARIQGQVGTAIQQPNVSNPQNQDWGLPVVDQASTQIDRRDTNQSLSDRKLSNSPQRETKDRHEVSIEDGSSLEPSTRSYRVQDGDGKWVYQDENGRSLRPARPRSNSGRHRADSDTASVSAEIAELNIGATNRKVRVQNENPVNAKGNSCTPESTIRPHKAPPLDRRKSLSSAGRMPTLPEGKVRTGREFSGTGGDVETLDARYSTQTNAKKFFIRGRVFSLLWHEPAGQSNTDMSKPIAVTRGRFGDEIHSHFVRMIVAKEGHGSCLCFPVHTYGGRGVSKPGFSKADRKAHSIIYMSDTKPKKLAEELDMNKKPIAVDKASPEQKLDEMSRINFSRIHTVIWNVKVMDVGIVSRESMPSLVAYWRQATD